MCIVDSTDNKKKALSFFQKRKYQTTLSLPHLEKRFPKAFLPGQCPVCGVSLSSTDMRPKGRASRCMCVSCYGKLIAEKINTDCFVCGDRLDHDKIKEQLDNPREIVEHIHDGECWSIWTIIHNIVLGERDVIETLSLPEPVKKHSFTNRLLGSMATYNGKPVKVIA